MTSSLSSLENEHESGWFLKQRADPERGTESGNLPSAGF